MFRHRRLALIGALVASLTVTGTALAAAAWRGAPVATVSGNTLTVTFKATGLSTSNGTFVLSGTADVTARCYTKQGNPGPDKFTSSGSIAATGTFTARKGAVAGTITVTPLSPLTCKGGQTVVVESFAPSLTLAGPDGLVYSSFTGF